MKSLKIEAVLTYDDKLMHSDDPDAIRWFYHNLLKEKFIVHSNEIGDEVGTLELIDWKVQDG